MRFKTQTMGLKFNYIKSNYDSKLDLNAVNIDIDVIIATERRDFGGFSFAQSLFLIENTFGLKEDQVDIFRISETISVKNTNVPPIILTPIVKNDSFQANDLLLDIVAFSQANNYRRILITNFIRVTSSQIQNVLGLNKAREEASSDFDLIIDFLIDENYIHEFTSSYVK
jgi:hypothetical protein